MKDVLHIVPATPFGGLQRVAAVLAAEQRKHGLNAHVLALYTNAHLQQLLVAENIPHTIIPGTGPGLHALKEFRKVLSKNWSLLHIHGGLLWTNTIALCLKRTPVVYHAHNYPSGNHSLKLTILNVVNRSLIDLVIAVSRDVADAWTGTGFGSRVEVIHNAIKLPSHTTSDAVKSSRRPIVFGMTTRLAKDKGVLEFIDVAAAIHARQRDTRFVLAGDGPDKDVFENKIRERGLNGVFSLPGHVSELDAFWSRIDVALFTAPKEPFGLRILEAMAHRVPVVAYLTGSGSDEIFRSGTTAMTLPYCDADAMAGIALQLCDDPSLFGRLTKAAYADVLSRFSPLAMHERVIRAYDRVAK